MAYFLLRDYNILPKNELHWSPWVDTLSIVARALPKNACLLGEGVVESRKLEHAIGVHSDTHPLVQPIELGETVLFHLCGLLRYVAPLFV